MAADGTGRAVLWTGHPRCLCNEEYEMLRSCRGLNAILDSENRTRWSEGVDDVLLSILRLWLHFAYNPTQVEASCWRCWQIVTLGSRGFRSSGRRCQSWRCYAVHSLQLWTSSEILTTQLRSCLSLSLSLYTTELSASFHCFLIPLAISTAAQRTLIARPVVCRAEAPTGKTSLRRELALDHSDSDNLTV